MPDTRAQTKNHQVVLDGPGTNVPGTGTGPARVCLISLYNTIAPGLRVLSAVLKERGHQVEVVFLHGDVSTCNHPEPVSDAELGLLNDLCLDLKPDLVGLGVTSSFLHPLAREVTASLRQAVDAPIVWGGSHATIMPEECVDFADFVCVGEGEYSLPALVEAVQSGNSRAIREVPGLVYCDGDAIFRNRDRAPVRDLDSLPYQDIDATGKYLVECDRVVRLEPLSIRSTYPTYASRGCPFECTFCSRDLINEASGLTRAIRYRSPEHVIGELEIAKRTCVNIRTIRFWDDTFPIRASWLREFCQLYAERIGLPFEVWLHPRSARLDSLRMMRQAGLSSVGMGIESGSQRLRRDLFGRPETQEDIIAASKALHACGVAHVTFDLILEHEYESDEDRKETFELLLDLTPPFTMNMHGLSYLPKTALAQRALADGVVTQDRLDLLLEEGLEANMLRHRWITGPHLDGGDSGKLVWPRLNFLTQYSCLPRSALRTLARRASDSKLIAALTIRLVDLSWAAQEWRPELAYPGVMNRVRTARLEPLLRSHPSLVALGRIGLAAMRGIGRARRRLMHGPR